MSDDFDSNIDRLLLDFDRTVTAEKTAIELTQARRAEFLSEFEIVKARVILPALQRFEQKKSQTVSFKLSHSDFSVLLRIILDNREHTINFYADDACRRVEAHGVGRTIPRSELGGVTEDWVKQVVESALKTLLDERKSSGRRQ